MCNIQAQNADYLFMVRQAVQAPSGHNTQHLVNCVNGLCMWK